MMNLSRMTKFMKTQQQMVKQLCTESQTKDTVNKIVKTTTEIAKALIIPKIYFH